MPGKLENQDPYRGELGDQLGFGAITYRIQLNTTLIKPGQKIHQYTSISKFRNKVIEYTPINVCGTNQREVNMKLQGNQLLYFVN